MNRIDHTRHDHPATAAARTACRKAGEVALAEAVTARAKALGMAKDGNSRRRTQAINDMHNKIRVYSHLRGVPFSTAIKLVTDASV